MASLTIDADVTVTDYDLSGSLSSDAENTSSASKTCSASGTKYLAKSITFIKPGIYYIHGSVTFQKGSNWTGQVAIELYDRNSTASDYMIAGCKSLGSIGNNYWTARNFQTVVNITAPNTTYYCYVHIIGTTGSVNAVCHAKRLL